MGWRGGEFSFEAGELDKSQIRADIHGVFGVFIVFQAYIRVLDFRIGYITID